MTTTAGTGPFPSGTLMQSFISSPSTLTLSHKGAIACLLELGVATSTPRDRARTLSCQASTPWRIRVGVAAGGVRNRLRHPLARIAALRAAGGTRGGPPAAPGPPPPPPPPRVRRGARARVRARRG